jgi:CBS domain containing-hemolysin-like protein
MVYLLILLLSFAATVIFSGIEVAFISTDKLFLGINKKQDRLSTYLISRFTANGSKLQFTLLFGNVVSLTIFSYTMSWLTFDFFQPYISSPLLCPVVILILITCVILIATEVLPVTVFKFKSNYVLGEFSLPILVIYILFYPISKLFQLVSMLLIRIFVKSSASSNHPIRFGRFDIDETFTNINSQPDESDDYRHDVKIFQNALDFSNIKLRECFVPRPEIVSVPIIESVETLKRKFIETGLSKILVYQDSIDNIIGFAPSISLLLNPTNIASIVHKLPIVPETMPANKLLALFIQNHKSIALVVDEFGGTSGIVTMEDILEEILGDIEDEHDQKRYKEKKISENEFLWSARLEIDYINEKYNLDIPVTDEYETIAGFILSHHGSIPQTNDIVVIGRFSCKILRATATKIELVQVTIR